MQNPNGITTPGLLTSTDLSCIDRLVEECRAYDQLEMPLRRAASQSSEELNQFLYYHNDALVGIVTLLSGTEIEVLGAVHPALRRRGIGRLLLSLAADECGKRGASDFLLVCENASAAGCKFAEDLGGRLVFSEHLMALDLS